MYARARAIVRKLRPEIIDALGLAGAAEETVRTFGELDRHCRFELVAEPLPSIPDAVSIAAYRMLQEALSNVVKHAGAKRCRVTLRAPGGDHIVLVVEDDGRGFVVDAVDSGGLGLAGIRERALALRGRVEVESLLGKGTRLVIKLPLARDPRR